MVADQDEMFCVRGEGCKDVAFEDFAGFFDEDDSGSGVQELFCILGGCRCGAAYYTFPSDNVGVFLGPCVT